MSSSSQVIETDLSILRGLRVYAGRQTEPSERKSGVTSNCCTSAHLFAPKAACRLSPSHLTSPTMEPRSIKMPTDTVTEQKLSRALQAGASRSQPSTEQEVRASSIIVQFLLQNAPEFRELSRLRQQVCLIANVRPALQMQALKVTGLGKSRGR